MEEQILQILKSAPEKFLSIDEIIKKCAFLKGFEGKKLRKTLEKMVNDGSVVMTTRGKFALGANLGQMQGKLTGNTNGFAFFEPDGESEDYFVAERNLNGACHGDMVICREIVFKQKGRKHNFNKFEKRRREAEVIKIVQRGFEYVVGTLVLSPIGNTVIPDDKRFTDQIFIEKINGNIPRNSKVVVKVLDYPSRTKMCRGLISEVLGDANDLKVSTLSVVRSFNLIETFPTDVADEAKKVAVPVCDKDLQGRTDFRKDLVITIDGEDARDFDDAISLTKTKEGLFRLCVHIADVTNYVKPTSKLDQEAFRRGTSVYFPDMVLPMLPVELSNDVCSLNEHVDRLTLSVVMLIDGNGEVVDFNISKGVIRSTNRMTYTKVTKILEGDEELCKQYAHLVPMLKEMAKLTEILIGKRKRLGGIDFDLPETQFVLSDKYEVLDIKEKPRTLSDRLIEQFMVTTNEVVAKFCYEKALPFVYRVHEGPTPEKMRAFNEFVKTIGLDAHLPIEDVKPIDIQQFLNTLKDLPYESVVNKIMLRSMQKAVYYEKCLGHFGLGSKYYCHFTSPIRRYPDLIIHRIIKCFLDGELVGGRKNAFEEFVVTASERATITEQTADDAERAVDDLKKAEYMSKHIGEEFEGVCSGVNDAGVFVALDNTCEGFIDKDSLPKDTYYFQPERYRLVGKHNIYQLGDKLKIKVVSADLVLRRCNFALIEKDYTEQDGNNGVLCVTELNKKRKKTH